MTIQELQLAHERMCWVIVFAQRTNVALRGAFEGFFAK
jgi:hypothetical protein